MYARYTLGVLLVVYVLNFLDRQIISILAEDIRKDLGLADDQLAFLYGTAFAVFYAVFGIPLGRLADVWTRRSLIAAGLAVWSGMTALSGLARGFNGLAGARIGVGIGEASATPAAFSMLSDSFPPERRATVLAIYSSGIYIGAGLGLAIGGLVVDAWNAAWVGQTPPFGLRGWQVAYFVVGLPGLAVALWVWTLREPVRGALNGVPAKVHPHPFREFARELAAVLPPATAVHLFALGGARALAANTAAAAVVALGAAGLIALTGDTAQWSALGVGLYAAISWTQSLARRDPGAHELIFRTSSLRWSALGFSLLAFSGYGVGFWTPPLLQRVHGASASETGLAIGATAAAAGWLGVTLGGVLADRWKLSRGSGRLYLAMTTASLVVPVGMAFLNAGSLRAAVAINLPLAALGAAWIGAGASTVQDLVPPRLRASASAAYLLVITFVGLALGPYAIGEVSSRTGDLGQAMLLGLGANLAGVACLAIASRHLPRDEARVRELMRAAAGAAPLP